MEGIATRGKNYRTVGERFVTRRERFEQCKGTSPGFPVARIQKYQAAACLLLLLLLLHVDVDLLVVIWRCALAALLVAPASRVRVSNNLYMYM